MHSKNWTSLSKSTHSFSKLDHFVTENNFICTLKRCSLQKSVKFSPNFLILDFQLTLLTHFSKISHFKDDFFLFSTKQSSLLKEQR